ncbi:MAG: AIR synthase-related protein [Bacteroidota bacterium]
MSIYARRGVSAQKEEVHQAIRHLDQGLYPHAFCKMYPDMAGGDPEYVNIMHADGAGTKSILAYLYWKETGDLSVWKGIARDAVAMNLDDLLCVGVTDNSLFSSTIDRNKLLIGGDVLEAVIEGTREYFNLLSDYGIKIHYLGGETADVGDVVRTIAVNGTMMARWPKKQLITNQAISPGQVIVGLASYGTCHYEPEYNSGLGSNGLTSARHDILSKHYASAFPESFEPGLSDEVVYVGKHRLTDAFPMGDLNRSIGQMLLSPTRTYAPVIRQLLEQYPNEVKGMIHCSGGGQTKCMKYLPGPMHVIKDNLFTPPPIFQLIQQNSGADDREMFQVFNMGHRMEIFVEETAAAKVIALSQQFGVEAKVVGKVVPAENKLLTLQMGEKTIRFEY